MFMSDFSSFVTRSEIRLAGFLLFIPQFFGELIICPPPDYPEGGAYGPIQNEYKVGETVIIACKDSKKGDHVYYNSRVLTCTSKGEWSSKDPYCDISAGLKILTKSPVEDLKDRRSIFIDGDLTTCTQIVKGTEILPLSFDHEMVPYNVFLCFMEGQGSFDIHIGTVGSVTASAAELKKRCTGFNLGNLFSSKIENLTLQISTHENSSISLCEIHIYGRKDNDWCDYAPNSVPNGQLVVNRKRAVLRCKEGFQEREGREVYATCRNFKWSYQSLECVDARCKFPPADGVLNGQLEVRKNETILHCKDGFKEKHDRNIYAVCENNTWSYRTLECVEDDSQKNRACPPPDFPEVGRYEPVKDEYNTGERINYTCNHNTRMFVKHGPAEHPLLSTCRLNGKWSRVTPFCETPTKLKNPEVFSKLLESHDDTCFPTRNDTNEEIEFFLEPKGRVYATFICLGKGNKTVKFYGSLREQATYLPIGIIRFSWAHHTYKSDPNKQTCFLADYGKFGVKTESVSVEIASDRPSSIVLCQIEVYSQDDEWCEDPPEKSVPNGHLEVSRRRGILHCNEGFSEKHERNVYATCRNNTWSYRRLQCVETKIRKDHKILACPAPDFPENGGYEPEKRTYEVGMTITYYCNDGESPIFGETKVVCKSDGMWSGEMPFCDIPAKLSNSIASSIEGSKESNVTDGNNSTCFRSRNDTDEFLGFSLDREVIVYASKICWSEGRSKIDISMSESGPYSYDIDSEAAKSRCLLTHYNEKENRTDYITLRVSSDEGSSLSLCEIKVYTKDDEWCEHPPEISAPNGQLEVSRSKATLHCKEGFRRKNERRVYATCRNNTWSYQGLQCLEISCDPVVGNRSLEGEWESDGNTTKHTFRSKRTLKCKTGYRSEGNPLTVTCLGNGHWTRTSATCEKDEFLKDRILGIIVGSIGIFILIGLALFFIRSKKFRGIFVIYKSRKRKNSTSTIPLNTGSRRNKAQIREEITSV